MIVSDYLDLYSSARKRDKGWILDEIVVMTGWSRDHVRRLLARLANSSSQAQTQTQAQTRTPTAVLSPTSTPTSTPTTAQDPTSAQDPTASTSNQSSSTPSLAAPGATDRRRREGKYSADARATLERVWDWSGRQSGKYLAAVMPLLLDALERHGSLTTGHDGYSPSVRSELLAVSPASIDRYLRCARSCDFGTRNVSTRRSHTPSAEFLEFAGGENESEPGFFLVDTVAHPGTTLEGDYIVTLNATCMHSGWVFTRSLDDNAPDRIADVLQWSLDEITGIPFWVNAVELSNACNGVHALVGSWASGLDIHYSPMFKDHQRDRLPEASKHQHLVHEYGFINRYDSEQAREVLNGLWRAVNDRLNFFTPTRKPVAWVRDSVGHRKRIYDGPATPLERLSRAGVMSPAQEAELVAYRNSLDPAKLTADIDGWQAKLRELSDPLR